MLVRACRHPPFRQFMAGSSCINSHGQDAAWLPVSAARRPTERDLMPNHPGSGWTMFMRTAWMNVRGAMPGRPMIMGLLSHNRRLIGALLVSLMGNTRMRLHVGNLRGADCSFRPVSAIGTIGWIRPAAHSLEITERAAFHAHIFIQRHQHHLTFCKQSKSAAPSLEGSPERDRSA